jgi:hypothetical protein
MSETYDKIKSLFNSAARNARSGVQELQLYFSSLSWDIPNDFFCQIENHCTDDSEAVRTLGINKHFLVSS